MSKLDSALLFFSSSLSLVFGIGYGLLGVEWLRFYLPMLVLGWFMPIYIGYVRGSIILDSVEERIRGWTYFIIGLGFYVASPLLPRITDKILGSNSLFTILITIPVSLIIGYSTGRLSATFTTDVFKVRLKDMKEETKEAFSETRLSAILLANLAGLFSSVDLSRFSINLDFTLLLQVIIVSIGFLFLVMLIKTERRARKLLQTKARAPILLVAQMFNE